MCQFLTLLGLVLLATGGLVQGAKSRSTTTKSCEGLCLYHRVYGMMSADCYNRTCKRFPRHLKSDIEAIDAAFNRIREITKEDLEPYDSLKYLYLAENMITKINPDAFADKDDLLALDISYNSFASAAAIPEVIFHLPSLKHLYLSQNQNINIVEVIENAAPITAPLEQLDISFNQFDDEPWMRLPILGMVPTLIKYNVTGMSLILNASQFAGLCNLEYLVNGNCSLQFVNPCDCWSLNRWLAERHVKFENFTQQCSVAETECEYEISQDAMDLYTSCKLEHAEQVYQTKLNKSLLIGGCVMGVILIVLIIVVWRWRRTKVRQRRVRRQIVNHSDDAEEHIHNGGHY